MLSLFLCLFEFYQSHLENYICKLSCNSLTIVDAREPNASPRHVMLGFSEKLLLSSNGSFILVSSCFLFSTLSFVFFLFCAFFLNLKASDILLSHF